MWTSRLGNSINSGLTHYSKQMCGQSSPHVTRSTLSPIQSNSKSSKCCQGGHKPYSVQRHRFAPLAAPKHTSPRADLIWVKQDIDSRTGPAWVLTLRIIRRDAHEHSDAPRLCRLLRARRERP